MSGIMGRGLLLSLLSLVLTVGANAVTVSYVSTPAEPWNQPGNVNALDDVFGAGNWDRQEFGTAIGNGALNRDFVFIDGGNGSTAAFEIFMNANRAALETFVDNGGSLFLNAARWSGTDGFDLGFGATLMADSFSSGGQAVDPGHAIFNGATGSSWTGDWLAHDYVVGAGLTSLITNDFGETILAEMNYGAGRVMFGGLTLPFFGENASWSPETGALNRSILSYAANNANAPIPEPATMTLLGLGLVGLVARTRKNKKQA